MMRAFWTISSRALFCNSVNDTKPATTNPTTNTPMKTRLNLTTSFIALPPLPTSPASSVARQLRLTAPIRERLLILFRIDQPVPLRMLLDACRDGAAKGRIGQLGLPMTHHCFAHRGHTVDPVLHFGVSKVARAFR